MSESKKTLREIYNVARRAAPQGMAAWERIDRALEAVAAEGARKVYAELPPGDEGIFLAYQQAYNRISEERHTAAAEVVNAGERAGIAAVLAVQRKRLVEDDDGKTPGEVCYKTVLQTIPEVLAFTTDWWRMKSTYHDAWEAAAQAGGGAEVAWLKKELAETHDSKFAMLADQRDINDAEKKVSNDRLVEALRTNGDLRDEVERLKRQRSEARKREERLKRQRSEARKREERLKSDAERYRKIREIVIGGSFDVAKFYSDEPEPEVPT